MRKGPSDAEQANVVDNGDGVQRGDQPSAPGTRSTEQTGSQSRRQKDGRAREQSAGHRRPSGHPCDAVDTREQEGIQRRHTEGRVERQTIGHDADGEPW